MHRHCSAAQLSVSKRTMFTYASHFLDRDILLTVVFFFFNDTATTEIYTLSLHDALPISRRGEYTKPPRESRSLTGRCRLSQDRKSTRLNSSHVRISYAVFCLKKKKKKKTNKLQ